MNEQPQTEKVVEVREVSQTTKATEHSAVSTIIRVIWYIVGIVVTILLIRFVLALLGANLENGFANFIYTITDPLVAPFRGLLQIGEFHAGIVRIEVETLLASVIYTLVGWGIVEAVALTKKEA